MQEEPLLLNDPVVPTPARLREMESGRAAAEFCLRSLNPVFVSAAGLVGIDKTAERLTVGAVEALSPETRGALQFATGLEVVCLSLSSDEIMAQERARDAGRKPLSLANRPSVTPFQEARESSSLFGLFMERFNGGFHRLSPYEPLAKLLEVGHTPCEASEILLLENGEGSSLRRPLTAIAVKLAQGMSLVDAVQDTQALPPHVQLALSACRDEASQPSVFVCLTRFEVEREQDASRGRSALAEAAILWTSLTLTWFQLFGLAGIPILAGGSWLVVRLFNLIARNRMNDLSRADVLTLVSRLDRLEIIPRSAIYTAMKWLETFMPTWGRLPDTREGLASALALPRLSRALLMKGDIAEATWRVAQDCAWRNAAAKERCVRMSRLGALAGFAIALALLLGQ